MKRITERDRILTVAERWDVQYSIHIEGLNMRATEEQLAISKRLHAMNLKKVKASTVDRVIGNDSWTTVQCGVCTERVPAVVAVYSEDEFAIKICESCLNLAKRVIQGKVQ